MKQQNFEQRHEALWREFELLLEKSHSSRSFLKQLKEKSLYENFPSEYQRLSHHLAIARHRRYSAALIDRLNGLVSLSHQYFYGSLPRFKENFSYYFYAGFAQVLRKNARYFWVASAFFYLPGLLLFFLCLTQENLIFSLMPPEHLRDFESMYEQGSEDFGRKRGSATDIQMFCFYIMNNIGISFQMFAGGIVFALGSLFFLVFNGVYIGAAAGHMAKLGYTDTFFPFVIGHGAFELTAITIAGAAGLKIGWAVVSPKYLARLESLKRASKEAIVLIYGSTLMLLLAAFVEAFWSSSSTLPNAVKYATGSGFWLLVVFYLLFAGRATPSRL